MSKVFFSHPHFTYAYPLPPHVVKATGLSQLPADSRCTIAYQITDTDIRFGVSFCSTVDNFSRKEGRLLAQQRLESSPVQIPYRPNRHTFHADILELIRNYIRIANVPWKPESIRTIEGFWYPVKLSAVRLRTPKLHVVDAPEVALEVPKE